MIKEYKKMADNNLNTKNFWRWLFITIILFWKEPDIIDAIIYYLTK